MKYAVVINAAFSYSLGEVEADDLDAAYARAWELADIVGEPELCEACAQRLSYVMMTDAPILVPVNG